MNIRAKRSSGNCVLVQVRGQVGNEEQVASTTYSWGPGKNPVVRIWKISQPLADNDGDIMQGCDDDDVDEFEMKSKGILSRTIYFDSSQWGHFEWRYAGRNERRLTDPSGKKSIHNLLVLEKVIGNGENEQRIKVAHLIRSEETRTPGTRSSCAGNGGRLEMCLNGVEGALMDEVTVVVTCLVMLKKEIDRLRAMQIAAISAGAGGGC